MDEDPPANKAKHTPKFASFGHGASRGFFKGRGRGGFGYQNRNANKKTKGNQADVNDVSMTELAEALPPME